MHEFEHIPENPTGAGLALTHGAGSDCRAPLLAAVAEAFCAAGVYVLRYDLAFRCLRPTGPPFPAGAAADRAGIREAARRVRERCAGPLILGGHSYGGRQTSMLVAEEPDLADGLLLLSYPLHPPGKPEQLRTAHFPGIRTRALFVQGSRDEFGSEAELRAAVSAIPAAEILMVEGAGHDLKRGRFDLAGMVGRVF